jgi:hypothetical protein
MLFNYVPQVLKFIIDDAYFLHGCYSNYIIKLFLKNHIHVNKVLLHINSIKEKKLHQCNVEKFYFYYYFFHKLMLYNKIITNIFRAHRSGTNMILHKNCRMIHGIHSCGWQHNEDVYWMLNNSRIKKKYISFH